MALSESDITPLPVVIEDQPTPAILALVPRPDFGPLAPNAVSAQLISGNQASTSFTLREVLVEPPTSETATVNLLEPTAGPLFADGFESGNASAWSP